MGLAVTTRIGFCTLQRNIGRQGPRTVRTTERLMVFIERFATYVRATGGRFGHQCALFQIGVRQRPTPVIGGFWQLIDVWSCVRTFYIAHRYFVSAIVGGFLPRVIETDNVNVRPQATTGQLGPNRCLGNVDIVDLHRNLD